jgi:alkylated DNA repair dioxygenase AlkB
MRRFGDYLKGYESRTMNIRAQPDLFAATPDWPQGFRYESGVISAEEQRGLVEQFQTLPFKEFEFQGFLGKRRVVSFGWRYDFNNGGFQKTESIPDFLLPLRKRAARFAGLDADALAHALVLEYPPGAAIGWHRDRPMFDDVIGVSIASPCTFRFRRKNGKKMGAAVAHRRAGLDGSNPWALADRMGAQHPRRGCVALFGDVSKSRQVASPHRGA